MEYSEMLEAILNAAVLRHNAFTEIEQVANPLS
jgi:hypothetical protein